MTETATSIRTLADRSPVVVIDGVSHVGVPDLSGSVSEWREVTTRCGVVSAPEQHSTIGGKPLETVDCTACREAELAIPFEHRVSTGRRQLGHSPIKGGGTFYGTTWRCTCGANGQINQAPSRGGTKAAEAAGARHIAKVVEAEVH